MSEPGGPQGERGMSLSEERVQLPDVAAVRRRLDEVDYLVDEGTATAMFFAINKKSLNEAQAISLMPILFYAPWAVFCTLAGYLADRYSKRDALVFWKFA